MESYEPVVLTLFEIWSVLSSSEVNCFSWYLDLLRCDVQIKDKRDSLLLQQAHSEPSQWKNNRQKMSGMHHDLSAPPRGEGSLNPRRCWRARLHTANSQHKRCRLSQAFRRTGQAPPSPAVYSLMCPAGIWGGRNTTQPTFFMVLHRPQSVFQLVLWTARSWLFCKSS